MVHFQANFPFTSTWIPRNLLSTCFPIDILFIDTSSARECQETNKCYLLYFNTKSLHALRLRGENDDFKKWLGRRISGDMKAIYFFLVVLRGFFFFQRKSVWKVFNVENDVSTFNQNSFHEIRAKKKIH